MSVSEFEMSLFETRGMIWKCADSLPTNKVLLWCMMFDGLGCLGGVEMVHKSLKCNKESVRFHERSKYTFLMVPKVLDVPSTLLRASGNQKLGESRRAEAAVDATAGPCLSSWIPFFSSPLQVPLSRFLLPGDAS